MVITRDQIVIEARSWIGTRYQHQQHRKGRATDCGGLVYGVGAALGLFPSDPALLPDAARFAGYGRHAHDGSLTNACALLLDPVAVADARAGDVVLMRFESEPQHVAILSDLRGHLGMIHAYAQGRKVVEHHLDEVWRNRIVAAYAFPESSR
jgi:NlpC/P60 family putative phage cell wall peptidase